MSTKTTPWTAPVREWMSLELIALAPDTPLAEVQRTLEVRNISAVPIVENDRLVGIVSSTDLLRAARIEIDSWGDVQRVVPPGQTAGDLMVRTVVTIGPQDPIRVAAERMLQHAIHRLIVVDGERALGVASATDLMGAVKQSRDPTPLSSLMSAPVREVALDDTIETAMERLADAKVHGLVVVDDGWPVGVFTQTEAIRARALPPDLRKLPVERVMSYEMICANVSTPAYRVAIHAMTMRARRIFAVDKGHLRGVATGFDLLRVMACPP
jgi:predicted transcriptional regulator